MGLGLLVLARALFRRVQAAFHISVWLLVAGIFASLLKGLDFEEASLLMLVLGVLLLGRRAFYRPTAILSERFTPAWVASILGVIAMAVWIGVVSYRHVAYSDQLWWTFALHGNAPRMLRASLAVIALGSAYVLLNLLRPARPEPAVAGPEELARARALIAVADYTVANAALTGDKRLLFSDAGRCLPHVPDRRPQLDRTRRSGRRRRRVPRSWYGACTRCPTITAARPSSTRCPASGWHCTSTWVSRH